MDTCTSTIDSPRLEKIAEAFAFQSQRDRTHVGEKGGPCRYCGGRVRSRPRGHLSPECLGKMKLYSWDECDDCNHLFGDYDNELALFAQPLLAVGNFPAKNGVPKLRGAGTTLERRKNSDGGTTLVMMSECNDFNEAMAVDPFTRTVDLQLPIENQRFRPMFAYKALSKIGFGLLPKSELENFTLLRKWLLDKDDIEGFDALEVGFRHGIIPHPFPTLHCSLNRRASDSDIIPYMHLVLTVGSLMFHIDLMPDTKDDLLPPLPFGATQIRWKSTLSGPEGTEPFEQQYLNPMHFNWASPARENHPFTGFHIRIGIVDQTIMIRPIHRVRAQEIGEAAIH